MSRRRTLKCPFCKKVVLTDWENADEAPDLARCERLVALLSWGCGVWEDPWVDEQRSRIVAGLLPRIPLRSGKPYKNLSDLFGATMFSPEKSFRHESDGWELATGSVYVEAGLGPQGGGPTYIGVFLRPTPRTADAKKSVKRKTSMSPTDQAPQETALRPRSEARKSTTGAAKKD